MTRKERKPNFLSNGEDNQGRRKTRTFELLEEAVQLLDVICKRLVEYRLKPKADASIDLLKLTKDEKQQIQKLKFRTKMPFKGQERMSEFHKHAIRGFRQGLKSGVDVGELSTKIIHQLRHKVKLPFKTIESSLDRLDRFELKCGKEATTTTAHRVDMYNKNLDVVKDQMEYLLKEVDLHKETVKHNPKIRGHTSDKTISGRSKAIMWDTGTKGATAVDIGNGRLLTCGHVREVMKEGGFEFVRKKKFSGYQRESFDIYKIGSECTPIKPSNGQPFAMCVERNGVFKTIPLFEPRNVSEALIQGELCKGDFIDFKNDSIGGDSGAAVIDVNGEYVGMIVATGLAFRLPKSFFNH
jgi:hypothetical protein